MLGNASNQVIGHADVDNARATGEDVDGELAHHSVNLVRGRERGVIK
jgi:hypothetical protein